MNKPSAIEVAQHLLAHAEEAEDPWLISYADLVTNLLAFMVLLVSMAGISFRSVEDIPRVFKTSSSPPPLAELQVAIEDMAKAEGLTGRVAAEVDTEGLAIRLEDQILFPSGVSSLTVEGRGLVGRVADLIDRMPARYRVMVEGHTDDVPIATPRFASNWELSAARALAVRGALTDGGVAEQRLAISAFADTRPLSSVSTQPLSVETRRERSRRVVLRVHY